jgi:hypothetical protein
MQNTTSSSVSCRQQDIDVEMGEYDAVLVLSPRSQAAAANYFFCFIGLAIEMVLILLISEQ